jgi:8-oxo-dGTP pyrophosphatase MutT (NUDIX family)
MNTIQQLKEKYPNIDINTDGGSDSFQEDKPIIERDPIAVIIKHPTDESYLIARWKKSNWNGFLTGGIEDGDTLEQTVVKEIHEETGYKNVGDIKQTDHVSHGLFFHPIKNVNRLAHYHLVIAKLKDLEQDIVSEEEKAIADFVWVEKDEVLGVLTRDNIKYLWNCYINL